MTIRTIFLSFALLIAFQSVTTADDQLRRKLGQLFIVGFTGPTVTDSVLADLSERNLGGVILSYVNGNLRSPEQMQQLISQIRSAARTPPFICADQEGGRVARLSANNGFASTYSAYTLGMVFQSPDSTRAQSKLMASWMAQCGFNLNLAPVVDVAASPYRQEMYAERRLSTDPAIVTAHARTFIEQFHDAGIMTTLKHFPGLARSEDLIPYVQLIDSTLVDMIMVGHNSVRSIDATFVTSLSPAAVQGLLRGTLRYRGVVITDDLYQMVTASLYGYGQAARLALNAGADVLLYVGSTNNNGSLVRQIIDTLETDVQEGRIAASRIEEAYTRITQLKNRYKLDSSPSRFVAGSPTPTDFSLSNYPNPFNATTTVRFALPTALDVRLSVFDVLGCEVALLVNERRDAGNHEIRFSATGLSSGVYFYRLSAGNFVATKRLILLK